LLKTYKAFVEQGAKAQKKIEESRVAGTSPSLALAKYAGAYKDEMYGDAKVALENGKLVLTTPAFTGDLEHWNYDTFRVTWRSRALGKALVTFTLNARGAIDEMKLPDLQLSFKRGPDAADTTPGVKLSESDLSKLAGKYEAKVPPIEISLEMVGGLLKAVVPGQPVYTLTPMSSTRFRIEGAPAGFFIQFEMADNKVKSMTIEQGPSVSLTLLPKP